MMHGPFGPTSTRHLHHVPTNVLVTNLQMNKNEHNNAQLEKFIGQLGLTGSRKKKLSFINHLDLRVRKCSLRSSEIFRTTITLGTKKKKEKEKKNL